MATARVTRKRYGSGNGANQEVHEAILRGASECFLRYGVKGTSMDDVAEAAGVSRATVYNYVTTKEHLVVELLILESGRINTEAWQRLDKELPSAELMAEAVLLVLEGALASPFAESLAMGEQARATAETMTGSPEFADTQRAYWSAVFDVVRERGELQPGLDEPEAMNWINTVLFTLASGLTTFGSDRETRRRYLVRYVAPGLVRVKPKKR